ncbi:sugar phosphate isomerase/epimerase family protein [Actinoplanes sp. NPDC020271]|uniref:sugar phosphate isomerase/epimerase family protein n=1 Tax=Actinoplanes sp. NPDC020271 TaxID=3363896 RepID=UPI0037B0D439
MRLRHPSGRIVHLTCGLSLTDAVTPADAFAALDTAATELRAALNRCGLANTGSAADPGPLTIALRLSHPLAAALVDDGRARTRLRAELDARSLEVVTLSGGPDAEGGGTPPESESAALPDWSEPARLQHTLELARILVDLLPEDEVRGAVGTCGLGPRETWDEAHERAGARHLGRLSGGLADLAWRVGRAVRVGFEPHPGYVLDSPEETVAALARVDKDRLGVCLDLARVVRDWPAPEDGIDRLTDAGLSVITVRITDPATAWQPILRHLLAADTARTEYIEVGGNGTAVADMTYVIGQLTALGLVPESEPCTAT